MTLSGSVLTLFDSRFRVDIDNRQTAEALFCEIYDSVTKQEEVSDELDSLKISNFRKDSGDVKDVLTEIIARLATLTPLPLKSIRKDIMLNRFPRTAVSGTG